jgi:predicted HD phosphohydrolase
MRVVQEVGDKFIKVLGNAELTLYFAYLEKCRGVKQMKNHHLEGDVLNHSLQCLDWALQESTDIDLVLAAMLHDIGKVNDSKGHEKIAIRWLNGVCSVKTLWLIEHHMRIQTLLLGQMKRKKKVRYLVEHCWLPELIMLTRWDKMARNPNKKTVFNKAFIAENLVRCMKDHFKQN